MRVRVDTDLCTGHGRCYAICPQVFDEDDAGRCLVIAADVPAPHEQRARQAADNCPEHAILVDA